MNAGEQLVPLLEHQRTLYRRLALLAERQRSLVAGEDTTPLLELLAERQRLVDGLGALNAKVAPFRRRWTELQDGLDPAMQEKIRTLLDEANRTLDAILQSDRDDCDRLAMRRADVAGRLSTIGASHQANSAYGAPRTLPAGGLTDAAG